MTDANPKYQPLPEAGSPQASGVLSKHFGSHTLLFRSSALGHDSGCMRLAGGEARQRPMTCEQQQDNDDDKGERVHAKQDEQ